MSPSRKICSLESVLALRDAARREGRTVVHCHGCFDIVHPGHVQYLQFARSQGDVLIVSLTADPQVNKGAARPLIPEDLRAANLAALECVDYVYVNPDPTAVELLGQLRPDVYEPPDAAGRSAPATSCGPTCSRARKPSAPPPRSRRSSWSACWTSSAGPPTGIRGFATRSTR